jgi:hypothetical protein
LAGLARLSNSDVFPDFDRTLGKLSNTASVAWQRHLTLSNDFTLHSGLQFLNVSEHFVQKYEKLPFMDTLFSDKMLIDTVP